MNNETLSSIKNRRSIRVFKEDQIKDEELQIILEAGMFAPNIGNQQLWHFTVLQNNELKEKITHNIKNEILTKSSDKFLIQMANNEKWHPFNNAPTVIFISYDQKSKMPQIECSFAAENMLIAAESIGIGSCFVGTPNFLFSSDKVNELNKELKIPENHKLLHTIILGYKKGDNQKGTGRKENRITIIK